MSKKIVLIGGGGHCKSCIDVIECDGTYEIAGIVDKHEKIGETVLGYSIIGCDDDLPMLASKYKNFIITVGQIKSPELRVSLFKKLTALNVKMPVIISPSAYVSKYATVGDGTIVMHHSIINAGSSIGKNCIINTKALCEHDVVVEDHCHISTASVLNGGCRVGEGSFIGSSSVSKQGATIPKGSIVSYGVKYE